MSHRKKHHPSGKKSLQIICLLTLFFVPDFKAAADVVNDPESVGWVSRSNMSGDDYADEYTERRENGYILIDIEVDRKDGELVVGSIWQRNLDGREWESRRNMTGERFNERWEEYNNKGYRLVDQESYIRGGERNYAAIWIDNTEEYKWGSWYGLTRTQYQEKVNELKSTHMLIDFEAYTSGGSTGYACAWVEEKKGLQWQASSGLTTDEMTDNYKTYEKDYRVHDIESYKVGGNQRYAVIWIKNTNGRESKQFRNMTRKDYLNRLYRYQDLGYRLTDFEQYETNSGTRYATVWRQNNDLHDWGPRSDIDTLAQNYRTTDPITGVARTSALPGLGVAIVNQGKILYQRGFGDQDDDGTWYSSKTINRLASVSKGVAGTLLYKLDDLGLIDPTARTSDYVPGLPKHHTHTLNDLASCRSQVTHYLLNEDREFEPFFPLDGKITGFPDGNPDRLIKPDNPTSTLVYNTAVDLQYNSALSACSLFWDRPLVADNLTNSWLLNSDRTPPYYHYSTHGYTLLGAAMEGATGKSISELIDQYMGAGIGLPTLKVEDRRVANYFRSKIFYENRVISADNSSWKVLGGGLEVSVEEMALFCAKLMGGEILSPESLSTMWTQPDTSWNYGMGWFSFLRRNNQNVRSVWRDGSQLGAKTFLRLYPDLEMGVVIFCNTRTPVNDPFNLALSISNRVLVSLFPVLSAEPISETINFGGNTLLSVSAVSNNTMSYQWRKDGVSIPGASSRTLSLSAESRADIGNYSVVVSNSAGSVVSSNASIYVLTPQIVEPLGMTDRKGFRLRFGDKDGYPLKKSDKDHFRVEWSSDLKKWSAIPASSYSVIGGKIVANDLTASGVDYRYYRVRQF